MGRNASGLVVSPIYHGAGACTLELCRVIWCGEYRSAVKISTRSTTPPTILSKERLLLSAHLGRKVPSSGRVLLGEPAYAARLMYYGQQTGTLMTNALGICEVGRLASFKRCLDCILRSYCVAGWWWHACC
jgi:hypothetical protein